MDLSHEESKQKKMAMVILVTESAPLLPWQYLHIKTCFPQNQAAICGVSHVAACRKESVCCCCEKTACLSETYLCVCVCWCVRKGRLLGRSGDRQQTERQSAPAEPALLCSEHAARTCSSADYTLLTRSWSLPRFHTHIPMPCTVCARLPPALLWAKNNCF